MIVETAVRRHLIADANVTRLATAGVHRYRMPVEIEQTGKAGLVVYTSGSWNTDLQTALFPRLIVQAHADGDRTVAGNQQADNADDKAKALLAQVDRLLHLPYRTMVRWGGPDGLWVLGSQRNAEPSQIVRPGETTALWQAVYAMKVVP